jgi:16S rRNA (guanine527-N7)-methyltransferase
VKAGLSYDASVDTAIIAALLRPFAELSSEQLAQTSTYVDLLLKWNAKVNLTAVRNREEIVTRHFGESFFVAARLAPLPGDTAIDLGSGAGFPGLPLAIFAPAVQVTLIESNAKKAAFLNEVISSLQLKNAEVFSRRAETYPAKADLVTMRAVEKFESALPVALGLVCDGGRLALMIGTSQVGVAKAFAPQVRWQQPLAVPGGHSRVLAVGIKPVIVD